MCRTPRTSAPARAEGGGGPAGMKAAVSDNTALLDVQAYKVDGDGGLSGGDLVQTAAQNMNSLTVAAFLFSLDGSGLAAGDLLMVRLHTAIHDNASGSAVEGIITDLAMLLDIKG